MDLASLIGMLGCLGMIAGTMISSAGSLGPFIDVPSCLIVIGGTFFAVMWTSPLPIFLGHFGAMAKCFLPPIKKMDAMIVRMVELAAISRKDGMMALEGQETPDKFFEKGMQLLVDGADEPKLVKQMSQEIDAMKFRHEQMHGVLSAWIDIAPAMGMIGTLIGLVVMLGNMSDPKAIGPAMAVALLTTLYGAILSNMVFFPIADKLALRREQETLNRRLVMDGVLAIQDGQNPRVIDGYLKNYLNEGKRALEIDE